jgi:broad-specificity NMP kinase
LSRKIAKLLHVPHLELNKLIIREKLYDSYDKVDKTFEVNVSRLQSLDKRFAVYKYDGARLQDVKLRKALFSLKQESTIKEVLAAIKGVTSKKTIIIDSHLSHYIRCDLCIVLRTNLKDLKRRLLRRGYSKKKIEDNMQSEIFRICLEEAKALKRSILVLE